MKVEFTLLIQFYLDYFLPRHADWGNNGIAFGLPNGDMVNVCPRQFHELLFPNDLDKTLESATLKIKKLDAFSQDPGVDVKFRFFDRIEVRFETSATSMQAAQTDSFLEEKINIAAKYTNLFLQHCRSVSGCSYIHLIEIIFQGPHKRIQIINPYSVACLSRDMKSNINIFAVDKGGFVNATLKSVTISAPESAVIPFSEITKSLNKNQEPDLPRELLVDADELLRAMHTRSAIVSIASALEVASEAKIFSLSTQEQDDWEDEESKQRKKRISFAERMYHNFPVFCKNRSFKSEHLNDYLLIERIYRIRNNVAHQGRVFEEDRAGNEFDVSNDEVYKCLQSAFKAVDWMAQL